MRTPIRIVTMLVVMLCPLAWTTHAVAEESEIRIANGWIRMPIGGEDPTAYFVAQSRSPSTRTIVGASSERCASIAIRRTAVIDGQWGSEGMPDGMAIPPMGAVAFAPRGLFLRMSGADTFSPGDEVPIVLEFANGERVGFDAVVKDD